MSIRDRFLSPQTSSFETEVSKLEITLANYEAIVAKIRRTTATRKSALNQHETISGTDLVEQYCLRSLLLSDKTNKTEKNALQHHFRQQNDRENFEFISNLKTEERRKIGTELARLWTANSNPKTETANRQAIDKTRKRSSAATGKIVASVFDKLPEMNDLARDEIAEIALKVGEMVTDKRMPLEAEKISGLAGVTQGLLRKKNQADPERKKQDRLPLTQWRSVVDKLAAAPDDPLAIWDEPRCFKTIARIVWIATLATGLRPIEWLSAAVIYVDAAGQRALALDHPDDARAYRETWTLAVKNAKTKSSDPTLMKTRDLKLGALDPETLDAILAMSSAAWSEGGEQEDTWRMWMGKASSWISKASLESGFHAPLSLYDARHYLSWRAKNLLNPIETAALMGHSHVRSSSGYGPRVRRRGGVGRSQLETGAVLPVAELAAVGVAAPSPADVAFIERRLTRMAGAEKIPGQPHDTLAKPR